MTIDRQSGGLVKAGDDDLLRRIAPPTSIAKLITDALAIEAEEARKAGALGFMARALVQATMPHRKQKDNEYVRQNGFFTLSMMAPRRIGLPYGSVPRLVLAWLSTEAVTTKSREIVLGHSLSDFMRQLGMVPTGGRWGTITRLREQIRRLFTTTISCSYDDGTKTGFEGEMGFRVADEHMLWWDAKSPDQTELFDSKVRLSETFFREIIEHPVPIDLRALKALSRSPMALDLYVWLTHRMSYLRRNTVVPWPALQAQFGADYDRTRAFKAALIDQLRKVLMVYPNAKVQPEDHGLLLRPSPTHVRRSISAG